MTRKQTILFMVLMAYLAFLAAVALLAYRKLGLFVAASSLQ